MQNIPSLAELEAELQEFKVSLDQRADLLELLAFKGRQEYKALQESKV